MMVGFVIMALAGKQELEKVMDLLALAGKLEPEKVVDLLVLVLEV